MKNNILEFIFKREFYERRTSNPSKIVFVLYIESIKNHYRYKIDLVTQSDNIFRDINSVEMSWPFSKLDPSVLVKYKSAATILKRFK